MDKSLLKQLRDSQESPETLGKGSGGSGTNTCYSVQARMVEGCSPVILKFTHASFSQTVTDAKWETLHFPQVSRDKAGVKASIFDEKYADHGYYSYTAAQALRWWFLAEEPRFAVETRLLEHKFEFSYSAKPVRAICLIDPEKREDIMPDWGTKHESKS